MLFYILLFGFSGLALLLFLKGLFSQHYLTEHMGMAIVCFVISLVFSLPSWLSHSDDLGTIEAQQHVIQIAKNQTKLLNQRLKEFEYPKGALLNADSPVKSIVDQLSHWQQKEADAELAIAYAKRNIEQRRVGPMNKVIDFVGDYK